MVPDGVSKINFVYVPLDNLDHEWETIEVIRPVLNPVVYKDLVMGLDVAGGTQEETIAVGVPLGIFMSFRSQCFRRSSGTFGMSRMRCRREPAGTELPCLHRRRPICASHCMMLSEKRRCLWDNRPGSRNDVLSTLAQSTIKQPLRRLLV